MRKDNSESPPPVEQGIDGLALAWVVPFALSTITMCIGYVYKDSFVAASQLLICVAVAGMIGSFAWGVWQIRQAQLRLRLVAADCLKTTPNG